MSTSTLAAPQTTAIDPALAARILREGYGPGAWHGPDLRAALGDVDATTAFRRPGPHRHNIAEVAVHHAFYVRAAIERLGGTPDAFPFDGEDWFPIEDEHTMQWTAIAALVERLHTQLSSLVERPIRADKTPAEQMDLLLGITCHAVYHAGQIQLIKVLGAT